MASARASAATPPPRQVRQVDRRQDQLDRDDVEQVAASRAAWPASPGGAARRRRRGWRRRRSAGTAAWPRARRTDRWRAARTRRRAPGRTPPTRSRAPQGNQRRPRCRPGAIATSVSATKRVGDEHQASCAASRAVAARERGDHEAGDDGDADHHPAQLAQPELRVRKTASRTALVVVYAAIRRRMVANISAVRAPSPGRTSQMRSMRHRCPRIHLHLPNTRRVPGADVQVTSVTAVAALGDQPARTLNSRAATTWGSSRRRRIDEERPAAADPSVERRQPPDVERPALAS